MQPRHLHALSLFILRSSSTETPPPEPTSTTTEFKPLAIPETVDFKPVMMDTKYLNKDEQKYVESSFPNCSTPTAAGELIVPLFLRPKINKKIN